MAFLTRCGPPLVALVWLALGGGTVGAQAEPFAGARIRVFVRFAPQVATGRFVGADRDSLALSIAGIPDTVRFGWQEIARVEQLVGRRRQVGRGALIGFGSGAIVGAFLGAGIETEDVSSGTFAVGFGLALGAVGSVVGAVIGDAIGTERWVPVAQWSPPNGSGFLGMRLPLPVIRSRRP